MRSRFSGNGSSANAGNSEEIVPPTLLLCDDRCRPIVTALLGSSRGNLLPFVFKIARLTYPLHSYLPHQRDACIKWDEDTSRNQDCEFCHALLKIVLAFGPREHLPGSLIGVLPNLIDENQRWLPRLTISYSNGINRSLNLEPSAPRLFKLHRRQIHVKNAESRLINNRSVSKMLKSCRNLLKYCDSIHKNLNCHPVSVWNPGAMIRVIDVESASVTFAPPNCRYTALSYVWGGVDQPKLLDGMWRFFQTKGSLLTLPIPNTIKDAMTLTKGIGCRYLWVDSLCITQDDEQDRQVQIGMMHRIYSGAYLTIIAACGTDCNAGLSGIGMLLSDRTTLHIPGRNCSRHFVVTDAPSKEILDLTKWNTRAWTYQEQLFSQRTLIFTNWLVYFSCEGGACIVEPHMSSPVDCNHSTRSNQVMSLYATKIPIENRLEYIEGIQAGYICRSLTNPEDILSAFVGIQRYLTLTLKTDFICGLPREDFYLVIGWNSRGTRLTRPGFPTWSWTGWYHTSNSEFHLQLRMEGSRNVVYGPVIVFYHALRLLRPPEIFQISMASAPSPGCVIYNDHFTTSKSEVQQHWEERTSHSFDLTHNSLLLFCTSSAKLQLKRLRSANRTHWEWKTEFETFSVYTYEGTCLSEIWLPKSLAIVEGSFHEFIIIAVAGTIVEPVLFRPMMVKTEQGITYRVQICSYDVRADKWWLTCPERKIVIMG
ncbi:HET-domain-containing protein [Lepidopterella palustris CBS 459.81]|uniref:HET-domain-containing protein n=1 Tax=Lepidopterella palustris CBS 459.81 TaxID=1314670 RepID=A0A8E2E062_9PEZI|nr:HET-domain-containing protein [Lepidopterella palustris CBS 459.81]